MTASDDRRFLALALSLGRRGQGSTWPNPSVGCVIVRDRRVVGRGWTAPGGRPHAEPQALAQAGEAARGATAYVSLEPCAHHGKTPPCTDALIAAGIARVVAPMADTDPRVSGQGFDRLRAAGLDNINLDLMFAIPGQTMDIWKATMAETIAMGSEHLSCYEVIYEEDTPLYEQLQAGEFDVDEALACAMYDELIDTAAAAGFAQYEVANFAQHDGEPSAELPSRACRHNVNYWRGGACQALGPSASGYVDGRRIRNIANTERYCEQLALGQRAHESVEQLSPLASAGETAAFGLRMNAGWPFELFEQTTGHDLRAGWVGDMQRAVESDWGVRSDDRFHLTRQGMRFADTVAEWFIRPEP